ncbi:ATP-binding protein [Streptomyces sp. NPDC059786]|uniref:ATP-binding protein n=1 Tax=Streptomyces sp. NPDC059786 TaxID=3346946 RepID=UPI0036664830
MRFSSTPRGVRLARRLCAERLDAWGVPYDSDAHDVVTLVVAELCANAMRHGHVAGRDFHVELTGASGLAGPAAGTAVPTAVRVEVTDTRGESLPSCPATEPPSGGEPEPPTGGRGLVLVQALADRWGWRPREGGPGKTVWAECAVPPLPALRDRPDR